MSYCSDCAYFDPVKPEHERIANRPVFYTIDKRRWLTHAFTDLLELQRTGRIEPGIGDFRITDRTLTMAGRVLVGIKDRYLPAPSISALSGGGIQILWTTGDEAVEVTVFPDDGVGVARLLNDMPTKAMELQPAEYDRINEFLAELVGT